jgi:4,5-DOPA dioxygenase extradiol
MGGLVAGERSVTSVVRTVGTCAGYGALQGFAKRKTLLNRRTWIAAAAASAWGVHTGPLAAATWDHLKTLPRTARMPVLFLGHGSPMNAIEDNAYRRSWQALGADFGSKYPRPHLVLCVSAHWLTQGWWLTGMAKPKTIHDFGGFPQALFDQRFPAPGAPAAAAEIAKGVSSPRLVLDTDQWGYDHGTWSVLKPMFPQADIPVVQLSLDYSQHPQLHFELGRQLRALRERGVLIVGSGNVVHNLRRTVRSASAMQAHDWALWPTKPIPVGTTTCRCCMRPVRPTPTNRCGFSTPVSSRRLSRCARWCGVDRSDPPQAAKAASMSWASPAGVSVGA